jgi:hypothetical protein
MALINTFFSDNTFIEMITAHLGKQIDSGIWNMYDDVEELDLETKKKALSMAMYRHLVDEGKVIRDTENRMLLNYFDINEESFYDLCGNGTEKNEYISYYLHYLYYLGKPVMSYMIQERMETEKELPYDYAQYEKITPDEGEKLAQSALRYLTWGVEYTAYRSRIRGVVHELLTETPSANLRPGKELSGWLSSGENQENNYLESGTPIHTLNQYPDYDDYFTDNLIAEEVQYYDIDDRYFSIYEPNEIVKDSGTSGFKPSITTPYTIKNILEPENSVAIPGYPLPYVSMGIDTPRTFAYKMLQQKNAIEWFLEKYEENGEISSVIRERFTTVGTTLALDFTNEEDYRQGYVTEVGVLRANGGKVDELQLYGAGYYTKNITTAIPTDIKPFLPGRLIYTGEEYIAWDKDRRSPFLVDKIAGVDGPGLLAGSVSMTDFADRIMNLDNLPTGIILDGYTRMDEEYLNADFHNGKESVTIKFSGLDDEGKPRYHVNNEAESYLDTPYRFTRADFERSTVLVTDIKDIQIGDLLVNTKKNGEAKIGIVTGFTGAMPTEYGEDIRTYWNKVVVLSVTRGFRMATIGTWGNSGDENGSLIFGGFTATPENFEIRRLLKLTAGGSLAQSHGEDSWEMVNNTLTGLHTELTFERKGGIEEPWIPNTGELFKIPKIEITGVYKAEGSAKLKPVDGDIILLAPADMYWGEEPLDYAESLHSNIYRNKGGELEFYAYRRGTETRESREWKLATFSRTDGSETYSEEYNPQYFNTDGTCKEGYRLYVSGDTLIFSGQDTDGSEIEVSSFGVKATGDIRPGDDFILRFASAKDKSIVTEEDPANFIAIYDKKLLWRANLYIAERGNDWNDIHPWDAPLSENEWNTGNGKQTIDPADFNWWDNDLDYKIGAVAYSISCHDSPQEFNTKMEQQKTILDHYFNKNTDPYCAAIPNDKSGWTSTTAPDDRFLDPAPAGNDWQNYASGNSGVIINSETNYPYRPGYASERYAADTTPDKKEYERNEVTYIQQSTGVDCVGLVQRSASYADDNNYTLTPIYGYNWNTSEPCTGREFIIAEPHTTKPVCNVVRLVKVTDRASRFLQDAEFVYPLIEKLIPGDIVYYWSGSGYHVMMVASITYTEGRDTTVANIQLIEANYPSVLKTRSISNLGTTANPVSWIVGRLK